MHSMIPDSVGDTKISVRTVDEYVEGDLDYLDLLDARRNGKTLLLLVGVQSHQFQRALDLAAIAVRRGCMAIIGGPHPMTCDTTMLQGNGVSFALAEAESILGTILSDATHGELQPVYGIGQRWVRELEAPVLKMPSTADQKRYATSLIGLYPFRGCPFVCDFCSVIKIAGRNIRAQSIETTMETLRRAKQAGVQSIFMTSDNFNKYAEAEVLCEAIIEEKLGLRFFIQCDTQIVQQPRLLELFAKAGVFQIFLGIESLDPAALKHVHKTQNRPQFYTQIREMCDDVGINAHFSMINGFPSNTRTGILEQLEAVCEINPSMASFYTLCPIPGTKQYDDFMRDGLITETNMDRFDTICPTWQHPNLSWGELNELLRTCYLRFYSAKRLAQYRPKGSQMSWPTIASYYAFVNLTTGVYGHHPMSGGVYRLKRDGVDDYMSMRCDTYGFEHIPLPGSLALSATDKVYNDKAKIAVPARG